MAMDNMDDGWEDEVEEGWGDDELDLGSDDDEEASAALALASALDKNQKGPSSSTVNVDEGGWDWNDGNDDADDGLNSNMGDSSAVSQTSTTTTTTTTSVPSRAVTASSTVGQTSMPMPMPISVAEQKLMAYINELQNPKLLNSLNEQLDIQRNNPETALQLCHYYHDRPNLREYTLDAEVPRMDYQIMISDEMILTQATEIQRYFLDNPVDNLVDDMLLRSANQSILADVFPIITGPTSDKIIRMQFLANAVATHCRLVLDMRDGHVRSLQVDCSLTVSIPSGSGTSAKLDLATVRFMIHFSPEPSAPYVKYQLLSLKPIVDVDATLDREKIRNAAESMDPHQLETTEEMMIPTNSDNVRDNFLNSVMSTQTGFKSALREIDGVVNVSSKLNYLKKVSAAAFILHVPSAEEIMIAEQHGNGAPFNAHVSHASSKPLPGPKPIIGGLLMSGITRLAKAAALPEEKEATLLYRREQAPPPPPRPSSIQPQPPTATAKVASSTVKSTVQSKAFEITANTDDIPGGDDFDDMSGGGWSDDGLDDDLRDDLDDKLDDTELILKNTPGMESKGVAEDNSTRDNSTHSQNEVKLPATRAANIPEGRYTDTTPPEDDGVQESEVTEDGLSPELRSERDFLLQKLALISRTKNGQVDQCLPDDYVYDETTGFIPTRKRFVSRSEILNMRGAQYSRN